MPGEWLYWYYLIFLLPAVVAVLVLALSGLGAHHGGHGHGAHGFHGHHGGGAHHGGGMHHGGTAHHAPSAGAAHSQGAHGAHATHQHGHEAHGGGANAARQMLAFFGVGRAPVTLVIGSLMIGWGLFGVIALEILRPILRYPALFFLPAAAVALAGALICAKIFAEISARLMPQEGSAAIPSEGLMGLTGTVVYPVTEEGGRVHLFDAFRTLHVSPARIAPGHEPLAKGAEIIVAAMDPDHRYVIVEPLGFSARK